MVDDPTKSAPGQAVTDPNAPAAGATTPPAQGAGAQTPATPATPAGDDPAGKTVPLPALHEAREQIKALKEEMDAMKMQNAQVAFQPQQQFQQAPPQSQPQQTAQQLAEMWEDDPRQAMQTELMMAFNWYDKVNADMDTQEAETSKKYGDFDTYRNDIRGFLRGLSPVERARPGIIESAYFLMKGRNTDDIIKKREEDLLRKVQAGEHVQGFTGGIPSSSTAPAASKQPTMDQVKAADAMGVPIEEYMKNVR